MLVLITAFKFKKIGKIEIGCLRLAKTLELEKS